MFSTADFLTLQEKRRKKKKKPSSLAQIRTKVAPALLLHIISVTTFHCIKWSFSRCLVIATKVTLVIFEHDQKAVKSAQDAIKGKKGDLTQYV